eukprot:GAHX01002172.1.p1 GENE.GAHX01002172.1~~GAHX01002172.1.p1  ORF type:complete len:652 (-),score=91.74 GAHX01002172.1:754-2709(-)
MDSFLGVSIITKGPDFNQTSLIYNKKRVLTDIIMFILLVGFICSIGLLKWFFIDSTKYGFNEAIETNSSIVFTLGKKIIDPKDIVLDLNTINLLKEIRENFEDKIPTVEYYTTVKQGNTMKAWYSFKAHLSFLTKQFYLSLLYNKSLIILTIAAITILNVLFLFMFLYNRYFLFTLILPGWLFLLICLFITTTVTRTVSFYYISKSQAFTTFRIASMTLFLIASGYIFSCMLNMVAYVVKHQKVFQFYQTTASKLQKVNMSIVANLPYILMLKVFLVIYVYYNLLCIILDPYYMTTGEDNYTKFILMSLYACFSGLVLSNFTNCFIYTNIAQTIYIIYIMSIVKYNKDFDFVPFKKSYICIFRLLWNSGTIFIISIGNIFVYTILQFIIGLSNIVAGKKNIFMQTILTNLMCLTCNMKITKLGKRMFDKINLVWVAVSGSDFLNTSYRNIENKTAIYGSLYQLRKIGAGLRCVFNLTASFTCIVIYSTIYRPFNVTLMLQSGNISRDSFLEDVIVSLPILDFLVVGIMMYFCSNLVFIGLESVMDTTLFCYAETKRITRLHEQYVLPLSGYICFDGLGLAHKTSREKHKKLFVRVFKKDKTLIKKQEALYNNYNKETCKVEYKNLNDIKLYGKKSIKKFAEANKDIEKGGN